MIEGKISLSVGVYVITEDCCWTAKHVRTGRPQRNIEMDEISLLSLSTTELCHGRVELSVRLVVHGNQS